MAAPRTDACKRCGALGLFWAQSTRTNKWYLCNAMTVGVYVTKQVPCPWSPHKCVPPEIRRLAQATTEETS